MILKREFILILLLIIFPSVRNTAGQDLLYNNSVLSQGSWTRIAVIKAGIYRLSYSDLQGMGISNPANVSVYANNQGQLSFYNDNKARTDIEKVAFKMEKGSDNVFGEGDYIFFYAEGTHRWIYNSTKARYEFLRHHYCDTAYYFITSKPDDALFTETYTPPATSPDYTSSAHDVFYRHENESANILGSGREWYQQVASGMTTTINPEFSKLVTSEKVSYRIRVLGRSDKPTGFSFKQGSQSILTLAPPVLNMSDLNGLFASVAFSEGSVLPVSESPSFSLTFSGGSNSLSQGWIDYVDLNARAWSEYSSGQIIVSDYQSVAPGRVTKYIIKSPGQATVWDITDPVRPMQINTSFANGEITFIAGTDTLRKYIIFSQGSMLSPIILRDNIARQNLHSQSAVGMIIVTHPLFRKQAERIAELHRQNDGITSAVVTPQQIYNEFSGGIPDAAGIRNYVRMVYDRYKGTATPLRYLLLLGDGSYENKTRPPANTSYIPTWQSVNSNTGVLSFTSDDFYGLLDEGEGEAEGYLDIGIGRIPVDDTVSARAVVDKIERYMSNASFGSWRNLICLVADDEDNNLHVTDSENLNTIVASEAPEITANKIYLDAFKQVSSISGNTYPDATKAINNRIESGCLLLNYVGHGSETGLAHEKVITTNDINSWGNYNMLPLVVTATCEFSRFDNITINPVTGAKTANTSAGEMILLNPSGGGIALMSTTRVVYSAPNYTLNSNILRSLFDSADDGSSMRLGDIIREAKINSGSGTNKRNFLLLGDPALRLAWPRTGTVVTDSINGVSVVNETDTLKALSRITISGHIQDHSGSVDDSFNGIIEPVVYDKETAVTTLGNDGGSTKSYMASGSVIFRGVTSVTDGRFTFSFIVPLDINYSYGAGRITYYAYNETTDINGYYDKITVGGFSDSNIDDDEGPTIRLFMNDTLFRDGDITDNSPTLLAILADTSGINVSGTGIGHDIVAWLDDNTAGSEVLNSLFKSNQTGISSGTVRYPLSITENGYHTLTLRAWDNLNNFSQATLNFIVRTDGSFTITNILCYPNPVVSGTKFSITHNRPDEKIDVTITIFNSSGEVIRVLKESAETSGYKIPEIPWDGCTETGSRAARGVYIWKAEAITDSGENASATGRVVIF